MDAVAGATLLAFPRRCNAKAAAPDRSGRCELLSEHVRGGDALVSGPGIEGVGAAAIDPRCQADGRQATLTCPALGKRHHLPADSACPTGPVHHQRLHHRFGRLFQCRTFEEVQQRDRLPVNLGDENAMPRRVRYGVEPTANLLRFQAVAQLVEELPDGGDIARLHSPYGDPGITHRGIVEGGRRLLQVQLCCYGPAMRELFTIGYEGCTIADVLGALKEARVGLLIDIRAVPRSRKPGFSKRQLAAALDEHGIRYVHLQALGTPKPGRDAVRAGHPERMETIFRAHMEGDQPQVELADAAGLTRGARTCLLCFERDPMQCHRRIVAEMISSDTGLHITHLHAPW
jgi:Protein of unknown function, DUF488